MIQTAVAGLLTDRFGFDPEIIGPDALQRAIRNRMADSGFGDQGPFEYLKRHALSWLKSPSADRRRLLSAPCSTGEEAYSIAMALRDVGISSDRVQIDAVDLSRSALRQAKEGVFGDNSFRGEDLSYRDRHFAPTATGYRLRPELVRMINFTRGNVAEPLFLAEVEPYDVVFCRNLLIYFEETARGSLFENLARLVKPGGLLFLGASETAQVPKDHFVAVKHPRSFAFQRSRATNHHQPIASRALWQLTNEFRAAGRSSSAAGVGSTAPPGEPDVASCARRNDSPSERPGARDLESGGAPLGSAADAVESDAVENGMVDRARELADGGDLEAAANLCRECLQQDQSNAQAYYLLGLINQAHGRLEEAQECLDKTIYLEPKHREALIYRSLIAADRGDAEVAQRLMERAEKCA